MIHPSHKGFTLLIAVVLASVALSIGLALLDIAYKQVVLASSAKQSQAAFYAADSALECVLYWDQQQGAFSYATPNASITCNTLAIENYATSVSGLVRTTSFSIPCADGGILGEATIYKASDFATQIFVRGYNTCETDNARRIERGLKVTY